MSETFHSLKASGTEKEKEMENSDLMKISYTHFYSPIKTLLCNLQRVFIQVSNQTLGWKYFLNKHKFS